MISTFEGKAVGLRAPAPWQAPQSAHREDEREKRGHAEHDERPDEEEASAGISDAARYSNAFPHHVDDGDAHPKKRRTSVPYSQTTKIGTAVRFETPPFSNPRTMSSAR
jgi:hypothetical protein